MDSWDLLTEELQAFLKAKLNDRRTVLIVLNDDERCFVGTNMAVPDTIEFLQEVIDNVDSWKKRPDLVIQ